MSAMSTVSVLKRSFVLLVFLFLYSAIPAFASDQNPATCSNADIHTAIDNINNSGSNGDTITLPTCTGTMTTAWNITKGINLLCPGTSVLTDSTPRNASAIVINTTANFKISGCQFVPNHSDDINSCNNGGVSPCSQQFIEIQGTATRWEFVNVKMGTDGFPLVTERVFRNDSGCNTGVVHNSTFYVRNELFLSGAAACGGYTFGHYNWAIASNWGSLDQVVIENNNIYSHTAGGSRVANASVMDALNGPRFTIRFNTIENMYINPHGTESGQGERGVRLCEVYGNHVTFDDSSGGGSGFIFIRSGTCIAHHNATTGFLSTIFGVNYRANNAYPPFQGANDGTAAAGASPYDGTTSVIATGTHTGGNGASMVLATTGTTFGTTTYAPTRTNLVGVAGVYTGGHNYSICNTTQNWCSAILTTTDTTITSMPNIDPGDGCMSANNGCTTGHMIWNTNDNYEIRLPAYILDGIGRGKSDQMTGGVSSGIHMTPIQPFGNIREPMYVFDNTGSSIDGYTPATNYDPFTQDGRDIITDRPSSPAKVQADGTSLPATCTVYDGFWKTNGTNWNDGSNANYTGDGDFYQCTATNVWTKLYTPANYPWNGVACTPDHLSFIAQPVSAVLSASIGTVTVGVYDSGNNLCNGATNSISIAKDGSATWGSLSGTTPVSASSGIGTYSDLSVITTAGVGSIVAASSGLTSATSNSITISAPPVAVPISIKLKLRLKGQ